MSKQQHTRFCDMCDRMEDREKYVYLHWSGTAQDSLLLCDRCIEEQINHEEEEDCC